MNETGTRVNEDAWKSETRRSEKLNKRRRCGILVGSEQGRSTDPRAHPVRIQTLPLHRTAPHRIVRAAGIFQLAGGINC